MNDNARERLRQRCQDLCTECGIVVFLLSLITDGDRVARIEVEYENNINFELLEKLVKTFNTRKINLTCNTGYDSDPCHNRIIYINDPVIDGERT